MLQIKYIWTEKNKRQYPKVLGGLFWVRMNGALVGHMEKKKKLLIGSVRLMDVKMNTVPLHSAVVFPLVQGGFMVIRDPKKDPMSDLYSSFPFHLFLIPDSSGAALHNQLSK